MTISMGIIKVEVKIPELTKALEEFKNNRLKALEALTTELKSAAANTFNQLMQTEMTLFLGQPDQLDNKRNGFEVRDYALKGVGALRISVPVDRNRKFESSIIPKREQVDPRLRQDLALLHLAGISNRTLSMISKRILGVTVSKDSVHRSLATIEEGALAWLERPITEDYWALFIDGTNFRMQRRRSTEKEPTLVVIGLNKDNRMSILTIQPGQKDSASSWEQVFADLVKRGLNSQAVRIGVMDGLPGLESKFKETFTQAITGRCWVHALKNAMAKTPERLQVAFKSLADKVMYASSENAARVAFKELKLAMGPDAQRAVHSLEKDLDSLLAHYKFDVSTWRALRTTNPIERVNKELKRRTKSMDSVGERTLLVVAAFTALRLEFNWHKVPVDSKILNNLSFKTSQNVIENSMTELTKY